MELALIVFSILLGLFAVLALYDGFYLHIFKYRLHDRPESRAEHLTHTVRAVLFPFILYFLFLQQDCDTSFFIGLAVVALDILVLAADAWLEKDSRVFMGGLSRWEYILHLFVNGFHFASVAVFLVMKLQLVDGGIEIVSNFYGLKNYGLYRFLVANLLPGACLLAVLHVLVAIPRSAGIWNRYREKVTCC
jgi:hypothetical protein